MKTMVKGLGAAAFAAVLVFALAVCKEPEDSSPPKDKVISIAAVQGVAVPVKDGTPVKKIAENAQYGGTVIWDGNPDTFATNTVYTATITVKPKKGYTLKGVAAGFFTVEGAARYDNDANSGVITAVFPRTNAAAVNIAAIQGVSVPVTGGIPVKSITENAQYSGTVTWNGNPYTFAGDTTYSATITITPKAGYTLQGMPSNFFTVAEADIISEIHNADSRVITAVFPKTASTSASYITSVNIHITAPVKGAAPDTTASGAGNFTIGGVSWSPNNNPFLGGKVYTASVTLTVNSGHTFTGLSSATINWQNATIINNSGSAVTLSYTFPETDTKTVTGIAVKTQPAKLAYTHGDILDLTGLAVTLIHDDSTTEDIAAADFTAKNITAVPAAGDSLVYSTHNGQPVLIEYGLSACSTNNLALNRASPAAADFGISGAGTFTYDGSTREVTITPKEGKSAGTITVKYNNSTTAPSAAGTYTVTFDTAEAGDFNAASGLSAGTLTIEKAAPAAADFNISGTGTFTYNGSTREVTVTPKEGKSSGTITVKYNGSTTAPSSAGTYTVTFDAAAETNFNAASGLSAGTLAISKAAGASVSAPVLNTKTHNSIAINAVTAPSNGQTVEYAKNTSNTAPSTGWQTTTTFSSLSANTAYYIFARSKANDNYNAGTASNSLAVTTLQTVSQDRIEYYWVDEHGSLATTSGGITTVAVGATMTITAQSTGYAVKQWHLNGVNTGQSGNTYSFSSAAAGRHTVGLFVEKDGNLYNTNIIIIAGGATVTFDINGGTGTAPDPQIVMMGSSITLPNGSGFSRDGYTFGGWNTNASGTSSNYSAGDYYPPTANVTLYAQWIANYTVTFNANSGTGTVPDSQTVVFGYSITLPGGNGFSRTGYTFGGWNTNASGTGTNYNAGVYYYPTANVTLYAKWISTSNSNETSPYLLTAGTWENGSITSSASAVWYSFNVTSGTTYRVWWNDSYQGNSTKSLDILVDAAYSNGTAIFTRVDSAYSTAQSFTANQTGTVKLKVYPYSSGSTGTFGIVYSTGSARP